jgi:PAS domain S-box-containing protein
MHPGLKHWNIPRIALTIATGLAVVSLLVVVWSISSSPTGLSNPWPLRLVAFLASLAAMGFIFWRREQPHPGRPRTWLYIGVGVFLWTLGRLTWLGEAILGSAAIPTPGLENLFNLAGYLAIVGGILLDLPLQSPYKGFLGIGLDIGISTISLTMLAGMLFVEPLLSHGTAEPYRVYWSMALPLMDLVLLVSVFNSWLLTTHAGRRSALKWIGLAVSLFLIRDAIQAWYLVGFQNEFFAYYASIDPLGFGLIVYAASKDLSGDQQAEPTGKVAYPYTRGLIQLTLPFAATALMVWYAVVPWGPGSSLAPVAILAAGMCVILIVLRQGIRAGETEFLQVATLLDRAAEPAFVCDLAGSVHLSNPAFELCLGITSPPAAPVALSQFIDSQMRPLELMKEAARGGWSGEVTLRRVDGSTFPALLALRPMPRQGDRRQLLAGTAHDLSEQKSQQAVLQETTHQLQAVKAELEGFNATLEATVAERTFSLIQAKVQLEQQYQSLQVLDEMKSDFVSLVSHELRAPLTNISTGIELVLDQPEHLTEHTAQSLCLVQAEILRLNHFVESILDVSALDAGHTPFYANPMALGPLMASIQQQYAGLPDGNRLEWRIDAGLPYALADDRALRSIFIHLIDNALKYAPQGEITIETRTGDRRQIEVSIADSGPGFPEAAIPLLFDKFYRLHQGDAQEVYGHGLGLYIARRLLQAMDGDIRAENRPGGGACFTFWLKSIEEADGTEDPDR